MKKGEWTFLTNHGTVLAYIAKYPCSTAQHIAEVAGISIRAVQSIITDLEEDGYIEKRRRGRCNHYIVHPERPMRHRLQKDYCVGSVLQAIGCSLGVPVTEP